MKKIMLLSVVLGTVLMMGSCVYNKSYDPSCDKYLTVRSLDGNDSQIKEVAIYIYDSEGVLLDFYNNTINTPINIEKYRSKGILKVVAWGNAKAVPAPQTLSDHTLGSNKSEHRLVQNLSEESFGGVKLTQQPSDLFHGTATVNFNSGESFLNGIEIVYIKRVVSSYILTIRNIGKEFGITNGDYKVIIRHPKNGLDFDGNTIDGKSVYSTQITYNTNTDELTSSVSLALPTGGGGMAIDIYSSNKLIYTATYDKTNKLISLLPNKLHNFLIDFADTTGVELIVSGWGDVVIFQGFN